MTIKEYADARKRPVQSIYRIINRHEEQLQGHITQADIGGRKTKVIDAEGVEILDRYSRVSPVVVVTNEKDEQIAELENQNKALQAELFRTKDRLIEAHEEFEKALLQKDGQIAELTKQLLLLTAAENPETETAEDEAAGDPAAGEVAERPEQAAGDPEQGTAAAGLEGTEAETGTAGSGTDAAGIRSQEPEQQPEPARKWWQFWKR